LKSVFPPKSKAVQALFRLILLVVRSRTHSLTILRLSPFLDARFIDRLLDLFADKPPEGLVGNRELFERTIRHDHGITDAGGDTRLCPPPNARGEGLLAGNENLGVRVKRQKRRTPLFDEMIGDDDHRRLELRWMEDLPAVPTTPFTHTGVVASRCRTDLEAAVERVPRPRQWLNQKISELQSFFTGDDTNLCATFVPATDRPNCRRQALLLQAQMACGPDERIGPTVH
jgi:hypothetical protein